MIMHYMVMHGSWKLKGIYMKQTAAAASFWSAITMTMLRFDTRRAILFVPSYLATSTSK